MARYLAGKPPPSPPASTSSVAATEAKGADGDLNEEDLSALSPAAIVEKATRKILSLKSSPLTGYLLSGSTIPGSTAAAARSSSSSTKEVAALAPSSVLGAPPALEEEAEEQAG